SLSLNRASQERRERPVQKRGPAARSKAQCCDLSSTQASLVSLQSVNALLRALKCCPPGKGSRRPVAPVSLQFATPPVTRPAASGRTSGQPAGRRPGGYERR